MNELESFRTRLNSLKRPHPGDDEVPPVKIGPSVQEREDLRAQLADAGRREAELHAQLTELRAQLADSGQREAALRAQLADLQQRFQSDTNALKMQIILAGPAAVASSKWPAKVSQLEDENSRLRGEVSRLEGEVAHLMPSQVPTRQFDDSPPWCGEAQDVNSLDSLGDDLASTFTSEEWSALEQGFAQRAAKQSVVQTQPIPSSSSGSSSSSSSAIPSSVSSPPVTDSVQPPKRRNSAIMSSFSSPPVTDSVQPPKRRKTSKADEGKPVNFRSIHTDFGPFKPHFANAMKPFLGVHNLQETASGLVGLHDDFFKDGSPHEKQSIGDRFDALFTGFIASLRKSKTEFQNFRDALGMAPTPQRAPRTAKKVKHE
jgi:hypothetical protein